MRTSAAPAAVRLLGARRRQRSSAHSHAPPALAHSWRDGAGRGDAAPHRRSPRHQAGRAKRGRGSPAEPAPRGSAERPAFAAPARAGPAVRGAPRAGRAPAPTAEPRSKPPGEVTRAAALAPVAVCTERPSVAQNAWSVLECL